MDIDPIETEADFGRVLGELALYEANLRAAIAEGAASEEDDHHYDALCGALTAYEHAR